MMRTTLFLFLSLTIAVPLLAQPAEGEGAVPADTGELMKEASELIEESEELMKEAEEPTKSENATVVLLPKGDPAAGRQAFMELSCHSCHAVAKERDMPAPVSAVEGPELGRRQGRQEPGSLATSILAPSHRISDQHRAKLEGDLSPMADYADAMTVRQLIDVVAYLETLDEK